MRDRIRAYALQNAVEHKGRASIGPVIGKVIGAIPELKTDPKAASLLVKEIVDEVNSLGLDEQIRALNELGAPIKAMKKERGDLLPDLEGGLEGKVVMRFAPGPSGPLHIGHTRAAILNDEYVKRYKGRFILRLEDTNPEKLEPEAYTMIPEDLEWLGIEVHESFVQSDRMELYYDAVRELINVGGAYVCTSDTEVWRSLKESGHPVEDRGLPPDVHMDRWDKMLDGTYNEGEAFLVIKTDLNHPNPAVRDFVGMRLRDEPHPRTGNRYRAYPLYNLSVAFDDHLMGCTHILRGKDHLNNTLKQEYIYDYLGWKRPHFLHYGLVSIPDTLLKKSLIAQERREGRIEGWDDIRLGTLRALKARGFDPLSLRRYWLDVGIKPVDINFSWETLSAINKVVIDDRTNRYFFVGSPRLLSVAVDRPLEASIPLHPEHPERGARKYKLDPINGKIMVLVAEKDLKEQKKGVVFRLKDLCNIILETDGGSEASYAGQDLSSVKGERGRIIQWCLPGSPRCTILYPEDNMGPNEGVAEGFVVEEGRKGSLVQFERVGFCKVWLKGEELYANYGHK
ncbi:MAG: glutamate--tRNA ligase [Candidatus Thermoplasmatota archaeon]|nr:glutamate--tRNA ligase [Candidatus Thermoplasmatota archaeon]